MTSPEEKSTYVAPNDIQESILTLLRSDCAIDQQLSLKQIVAISAGSDEEKLYLLQCQIVQYLRPFYHPMVDHSALSDVSLIIRNLCDSKSTLPVEYVRALVIPLSILIFHRDLEILINACNAYKSLMDPKKLNKDYSADFLIHFGVRSIELFPLYHTKSKHDELILAKSIKQWETEFHLEIPDVIIAEISDYFTLFDKQQLQQIQINDILQKLVNEMDCFDVELQKIVLQTINYLCSQIDIFLFADEAIEYGVLEKLNKFGYLIHKDTQIRRLSYQLISTLIVNTVDTDCTEYIHDIKMLRPLIDLLGFIPDSNIDHLNEKQDLLQIFVHTINYGLHQEIQILIDENVHQSFFKALFYVLTHQDLGNSIRSAVDRLFRQFKPECMQQIIDDITKVAQQFKDNVSENIYDQYTKRIVELVTIIQLCLDHRGIDWKLCLPLLFSIA